MDEEWMKKGRRKRGKEVYSEKDGCIDE